MEYSRNDDDNDEFVSKFKNQLINERERESEERQWSMMLIFV